MHTRSLALIAVFSAVGAWAQTTPAFSYKWQSRTYTLAGNDPSRGVSTRIPVVVVSVALTFESEKQTTMDAAGDVSPLLNSPVFQPVSFSGKSPAQYGDAMLRASIPHAGEWHTILSSSGEVKAVHVSVPAADGYVLHSRSTGTVMAVADLEFVQREIFKQVPKQNGKLVLALTHNTAFYGEGDATLCCLWGTHGSDRATGNSFVLASYLKNAPPPMLDRDVQPLSEQLAQFLYDPLHDPLAREEEHSQQGNRFPKWIRPATMRPGDQGRCGGDRISSAYFLLEPTDTNRKNNFPYSPAFVVGAGDASYHLQNVALLPWYTGSPASNGFSFPDAGVLTRADQPCPDRGSNAADESSLPGAKPIAASATNGHALIGYWTGSGPNGKPFPLHEISPQWDTILVAFALPDHSAPEGTLRFQLPQGIDAVSFKRDIASLKKRGKKIIISMGGGGEYFSLDHKESIPNFVSSIGAILREYGFEGVDLDFETPSLVLSPGDTDFHHPTTPSIVHLLAGLRELRKEFGPSFLITLVPEGPQVIAGHVTYGGQFGSYLPIAYNLRDILTFMDVQDYNTPPLQGLDGEIYQAGPVDYHAAMTELVLRGFNVASTAGQAFPALPQDRVAVGFLIGETTPAIVAESMRYLITGQAPSGATYRLRRPQGYPQMIGAMFWTIDDDARQSYPFSNRIGPELHSFSGGRPAASDR